MAEEAKVSVVSGDGGEEQKPQEQAVTENGSAGHHEQQAATKAVDDPKEQEHDQKEKGKEKEKENGNTKGSKTKQKKTEEEKLAQKLAKEHGKGSAVKMKKVDEVVASWSGVNLSPFPGIPMHESKEIIIEDKLNEWMGGEVGKPSMPGSSSTSSSEAPSTPRKLSLIGNLPLPIIGTRSSEQANKVKGTGSLTNSRSHIGKEEKGRDDIKSRHEEIESAVADWVGVSDEVFHDPKNPQSSAAAFPGIRLHIIKSEKEEKEVAKEIEEKVAQWAGADT
eukprot:TRINITY_DN3425_c0_g1_i1.p1 TRINITY_DN3425_c0_g1~~TRINITY_DN3425_c0_g1_i1.p1  ORF type:complete len:278 (-),score=95.06 TRINITY_DN3425_c0_g1_i1:153-986(-)